MPKTTTSPLAPSESTRRVQIVEDKYPSSYGSRVHKTYTLIVRDVFNSPREIDAVYVYHRNRGAQWILADQARKHREKEHFSIYADTPEGKKERYARPLTLKDFVRVEKGRAEFDNKQVAIATAKREAVALGLPFVPSKDYVEDEELFHGPEQTCPACGKNVGHHTAPKLCQECLSALEAGRTVVKERPAFLVQYDDLIAYGYGINNTSGNSRDLASFMAKAIGVKADEYERFGRVEIQGEIKLPTKRETSNRWKHILRITDEQAKAYQRLVNLINNLIAEAFKSGQRDGAGFIRRIAAGELTVDQVTEGMDKIAHSANVIEVDLDEDDETEDGEEEYAD